MKKVVKLRVLQQLAVIYGHLSIRVNGHIRFRNFCFRYFEHKWSWFRTSGSNQKLFFPWFFLNISFILDVCSFAYEKKKKRITLNNTGNRTNNSVSKYTKIYSIYHWDICRWHVFHSFDCCVYWHSVSLFVDQFARMMILKAKRCHKSAGIQCQTRIDVRKNVSHFPFLRHRWDSLSNKQHIDTYKSHGISS